MARTISHSFTALTRKIHVLFLPLEQKINILSPLCNISCMCWMRNSLNFQSTFCTHCAFCIQSAVCILYWLDQNSTPGFPCHHRGWSTLFLPGDSGVGGQRQKLLEGRPFWIQCWTFCWVTPVHPWWGQNCKYSDTYFLSHVNAEM